MMLGAAPASLLAALRDTVDPEYVQEGGGLNVNGLRVPIVVRPGSSAQIAACARTVRDYHGAVVPWGGGTLQRIGFPPERADVILDCSRVSGIVDWEPADLTAGILAGTTLAAAQAAFAEQGQQIAVDAPAAESATIGGLVAAGVSGPRRWLYGGWRDQIVGMEMALSGGDLIKSGGRVVKNVQGYDLSKLFTGSLGTLGVITRVNVRLLPLPEARCLAVVRGSIDRLDSLATAVAGSMLRIVALDLLDAAAAAACGLDGRTGAALLLLEGSDALVAGQAARLTTTARELELVGETLDGDVLSQVWERRLNLDRLDDLSENEARLRTTVLPSASALTLAEIRLAAERRGFAARCWAEAAVGTVSARISGGEDGIAASLPALVSDLLGHLPSMTVASGDPQLQRRVAAWGADPQGLDLMRSLKRRFDPTRTLQPGRYVGGI